MSNRLQTTLQNLPTIAKYLLVLLVIVFISLLSPSRNEGISSIKQGQTWQNDDLVAAFDFNVPKSGSDLDESYLQIEETFEPVYEIQTSVAKKKKRDFNTTFQNKLSFISSEAQYIDVLENPKPYLQYAFRLIDNVYNDGIIELAKQHQNQEENFVIQILKNNTLRKRALVDIPTVQVVAEAINDSLFKSGLREADFLIPIFQNFFTPNLIYKDSLNQEFLDEQKSKIEQYGDKIEEGEIIVAKDELITADIYQQIAAYQKQHKDAIPTSGRSIWSFIGYLILTTLMVGVFLLYLQFNARHIFDRFPQLVFILLWIVVYSYLVYIVGTNENLSPYLIPFCIVPIVIKNFYDERIALFTHVVVILIASYLSSLGYEFIFIQMVAGVVAVLAYENIRDWSKFFLTIFFIFLAYGIAYFGLSIIKEGNIANLNWTTCEWLILSTFFTLMAYPLIPLLERLFGFTSSITLLELSDMNRPLLKELAVKAPGTLQHSLQVAHLSEAAASEIGANALLAKVAALYHDIGKMSNPLFFIENQKANANPHDEISDLESAQIIIKHVEEGVKIAKKYRLPNRIIDIIKTHHGTTRVEYFYRNYKKAHPDKEVDPIDFSYTGPKPSTKEETILMLADSLEAAAKTLKNPTAKAIDDLVDNIVVGKISMGQLEESEMSFAELESCILVFKKVLRSFNHLRVEYPK